MPDENTAETQQTIVDVRMVREVVGIVDSPEELETAVDYLNAVGVDRGDIDLMADRWTILRKLGKYYSEAQSVAGKPDVPRQALIMREDSAEGEAAAFGLFTYLGALGAAGAVMATGGALPAAALAALAGGAASGGLGAVLGRSLGRRKSDKLRQQLEGGGLVLFARIHSPETESKALSAMRNAGAQDVHVHEINLPETIDDIPLSKINPDPWLGDERLGDVS